MDKLVATASGAVTAVRGSQSSQTNATWDRCESDTNA